MFCLIFLSDDDEEEDRVLEDDDDEEDDDDLDVEVNDDRSSVPFSSPLSYSLLESQ
jgi:hypothetical protein